jgi:glutathione synthase
MITVPPTYRLCMILDPFDQLNPAKDSSIAIIEAALKRGWECHVTTMETLFYRQGKVMASTQQLSLATLSTFTQHALPQEPCLYSLTEFSVVMMRKDPPVDARYWHATHLLSLAEQQGAYIINQPKALRDANEKLLALSFPDCCPPTLVASQRKPIIEFLQQYGTSILKPLDGMGGESIFRVEPHEPNLNVILELMTQRQTQLIIVQQYLPAIQQGDKRILLINGDPIPYALARIPATGEIRGNLAAGGKGVGVELTERDHWICQRLKPVLQEKGLVFVGIDVIGDYLTEINVTSPTCIREIDTIFNISIGELLINFFENNCLAI